MLYEGIVDFTKDDARRAFLDKLKNVRAVLRIEVKKYRKTHSNNQRAYYFAAFVRLFGNYLREEGNEVSDEQVHSFFKWQFLSKEILDENTGKSIRMPGSTKPLTTTEFNEMLDRIAAYLVMEHGLIVPEPSMYRITEEKPDYRLIA